MSVDLDAARHAGLLAHSPDGSALAYLEFCHRGADRLGAHLHPDITLDFIAMGRSMPHWDAGDIAPIREILARSIERLAAAGADFFFCPDNTAHIALEAEGAPFALPGLHIADIVAETAAREGRRKIGVIGTRYTMDGPVYRRALAARRLDHAVPPPEAREMINRVIFEELCAGKFLETSRRAYLDVIDELKAQGCDAVALVCTEIPLLITPEITSLPTLDSTRLLARAALDAALGDTGLPTWRGGPVSG